MPSEARRRVHPEKRPCIWYRVGWNWRCRLDHPVRQELPTRILRISHCVANQGGCVADHGVATDLFPSTESIDLERLYSSAARSWISSNFDLLVSDQWIHHIQSEVFHPVDLSLNVCSVLWVSALQLELCSLHSSMLLLWSPRSPWV
jgi:hypothetical protein